MAYILIVDTEPARVQELQSALTAANHQTEHARGPDEAKDLTGNVFAAAVVLIRDPLSRYLDFIRELKSGAKRTSVLAVFGGGALPADYALSLAQIYDADVILYQPHSIVELVKAVEAMLGAS